MFCGFYKANLEHFARKCLDSPILMAIRDQRNLYLAVLALVSKSTKHSRYSTFIHYYSISFWLIHLHYESQLELFIQNIVCWLSLASCLPGLVDLPVKRPLIIFLRSFSSSIRKDKTALTISALTETNMKYNVLPRIPIRIPWYMYMSGAGRII